MGSVFERPGSKFLWLRWTVNGIEERRSSQTTDRAEAEALLAEVERQVQERSPAEAGPSVERFFYATWLPLRKQVRPFAWKTDSGRLRTHFLPTFGERPIAWLGTDAGEVALVDWLVGLRTRRAKRDGSPLAGRTVWNTASIVRVFLADALERKVLKRDLCASIRWAKYMPEKRDKAMGLRQPSADG